MELHSSTAPPYIINIYGVYNFEEVEMNAGAFRSSSASIFYDMC